MFDKILQFFRRETPPERRDRPLDHAPKPKLGVALSSGGARGLAHVGVLQVLEENGIEIHALAGSSMGSYVGALWAAGFSGKALEELAEEMHDSRQLWKLADPIFPPMSGLFRGVKARRHLERSLDELRFEDLERRLLVVTVDINTKERLVLRSGRISDAVHASCAMPGVIAPVMIKGHRCVDGGVVDPVPVGALHKFSDVDRVLAVSVIPTFEDIEFGRVHEYEGPPPSRWRRFVSSTNRSVNLLAQGNMIDTFRQSIRAAQIRMAHDSCRRADLCLRPEHFSAPWHDYSSFRRFIDAGRKVAEDNLDAIRALVHPDFQSHEIQASRNVVGHRIA